jgi:CheY-like chemotaxis protein
MYFPRRVQIREEVEVKPKSVAPGFEGSETVLIADDEEALLELASEILNHQGYKTICVSNGREALEILKQTSVDLLISDVIMPEMGGYELAGIVQQMYPATKIQLVSGFNDERERQEVDEYLLKTLLLKPYEPKVLLERVRRLLDEPYPTPDQAPLRTNVLHC